MYRGQEYKILISDPPPLAHPPFSLIDIHMSSPSFSRPPENPDRRPLPLGWTTQYDPSYHAWYYVDTTKNQSQSQWHHPLDRPSSANPQPSFAPPPNPPPRSAYASYQQAPGGYNPGGGYVDPQDRGYQQQQPPQQPHYTPPGYDGYRNQGQGWPGWQQQQQQQPPQPVYVSPSGQPAVQQPTNAGRHHLGRGGGLGTAALAGGAGILGGVVLAEAFERHERHDEAEAYTEGFADAQYQDGDYVDPDYRGDW
ncbi:hypothetical protein BGW80DRAFT_1352120 [Lactifluus volemus]|nr:hypothetical protein BGW80DRAFT_1352120 [Lactifluus volemus]